MTAGAGITGAPPGPRLVLVTRPAFDEPTRAAIEALGCRAVLAPLQRIDRFAIGLPPGIQGILVTSGNALPGLPRTPLRLLAVGDATAERARTHGFDQVLSAGGDATALAALAARVADPGAGPLLLATGARQGHALAANLRGRGFRVIRRVCYASRPVHRFPEAASAALRSGHLHAALFLSAETAGVFVRLLPPALRGAVSGVTALAIGPTTAEVLEKLPWLRICRARTPTLDDVLALL